MSDMTINHVNADGESNGIVRFGSWYGFIININHLLNLLGNGDKLMKLIVKLLIISVLNIFTSSVWADNLIGDWKVIDETSGYARGKINIYKLIDGSYEGKIEEVYALPNQKELYSDKCFRCKGKLKDVPLVGMKTISGFKENESKIGEYTDGNVIDPMTGNIYKGKIKINARGNMLTIRGYSGGSALGRSQVWMKVD